MAEPWVEAKPISVSVDRNARVLTATGPTAVNLLQPLGMPVPVDTAERNRPVSPGKHSG